jgi:hypothetical protein
MASRYLPSIHEILRLVLGNCQIFAVACEIKPDLKNSLRLAILAMRVWMALNE